MTILGLMYAAQNAMKIDSKSPDALQFIKGLLSTLEQIKGQLKNLDAITNEVGFSFVSITFFLEKILDF